MSIPDDIDNSQPWRTFMFKVYSSRRPPSPLGTVDCKQIEAKAREVLKDYPGSFLYAFGSAGTNSTCSANLKAFENFRIVPRMLVDSSTRSLETTIFGTKYPSPLVIAPIGVQSIFHKDCEFATARAAKNLGVPFILSTASSHGIEAVAEANGDGSRWFQLYWPRTDEVTLSLLNRAKASGFKALVVTLDTMTLGWRPHDLDTAYLPFAHGVGIGVGKTDPVFMKRYNRQPIINENLDFPYDPAARDKLYLAGDKATREGVYFGTEWLKECNSGVFRSWGDLKLLRDNWEGPLVLKGIQNVIDAENAVKYGADGIIVSNHGGRQVDGAIPSLYALEEIMKSPLIKTKQARGEFTVLFDSGVRTGSDIFKAIALGAQAVLLGRPWLYGLIVAGQAGVEQVITHTLADLDCTLGLAGYQNLNDLREQGHVAITKMNV